MRLFLIAPNHWSYFKFIFQLIHAMPWHSPPSIDSQWKRRVAADMLDSLSETRSRGYRSVLCLVSPPRGMLPLCLSVLMLTLLAVMPSKSIILFGLLVSSALVLYTSVNPSLYSCGCVCTLVLHFPSRWMALLCLLCFHCYDWLSL